MHNTGTRPAAVAASDATVVDVCARDGLFAIAVVCPAPAVVAKPVPMRHVPSSALVVLADGTLWHLRTARAAWSDEALDAAAALLRAQATPGRRADELAALLSYELGIPGIEVLAPTPHDVDADAWQTRKIAVALHLRAVLRQGRTPTGAQLDAEVVALDDALRAEIGAAIEQVRARLDDVALHAATGAGFDAGVYNFLAESQHAAERRQFVVAYPCLARVTAAGERGSIGAAIRAAVDRRLALGRFLAARFAVTPGTVRALVGQPAHDVGHHWGADPRALVAVLDLLRPEDRPRDAAGWRRFNEHVGAGRRTFGRAVWLSPLTLAWMRDAMRPHDDASTPTQALPDDLPALLAKVAVFRRAIIDFVDEGRDDAPTAPGTSGADAVVDRHLAMMGVATLARRCERFLAALDETRDTHGDDAAFIGGRRSRPLLAQDYVSRDSMRRVTCLIDRESLRAHGRALDICLADSHLDEYFAACNAGGTFLLAVRDAVTREPTSTVEVRVVASGISAALHAEVVQHTGRRNARPSAACERAVHETLALLATPDARRHLLAGLHDMARRKAHAFDTAVTQDRAAHKAALRRVLGDKGLLALARLRGKATAGDDRGDEDASPPSRPTP